MCALLPSPSQTRQGNVRPPMKAKMAGTTFSPESAKYGNADTYDKETRQFKQDVNGILPGYAGHIPAAREEVGAPATGSVPKEAGTQFAVVNEGAAGGILGGKVVGSGRCVLVAPPTLDAVSPATHLCTQGPARRRLSRTARLDAPFAAGWMV